MDAEGPTLQLEACTTGYGSHAILQAVTLAVQPGEIVGLIGHNASGKSTLLKMAYGLLPLWSGSVILEGNDISRLSPALRLKIGIRFAPQGGRIFRNLTVLEHLRIAANEAPKGIDDAFVAFPELRVLAKRQARLLSGGQRQWLVAACAFAGPARILLLDEPSLGVAGPTGKEFLERLAKTIHDRRASAIVVEHRVPQLRSIATRVSVLRRGCIVYDGSFDAISDDDLAGLFL